MTEDLKKEIEEIISLYGLNCSVEDFCLGNFTYSNFGFGFWTVYSTWTGKLSSKYKIPSKEFLWFFKDKIKWPLLYKKMLSEQDLLKYKLLGYIK